MRAGTGNGAEPAFAELLRTRLLERGVAVEVACPARCLELSLIEFAVDAAIASGVTPGQVPTVATGAVPVPGGLSRTLADRERAGAPRTTGLIVSCAARDGHRCTSRAHAIAIVSSSDGTVALERRQWGRRGGLGAPAQSAEPGARSAVLRVRAVARGQHGDGQFGGSCRTGDRLADPRVYCAPSFGRPALPAVRCR